MCTLKAGAPLQCVKCVCVLTHHIWGHILNIKPVLWNRTVCLIGDNIDVSINIRLGLGADVVWIHAVWIGYGYGCGKGIWNESKSMQCPPEMLSVFVSKCEYM